MVLVADSWDDLKATLVSMDTRCSDMGHCKKTNTLAVLPSVSCSSPVSISLCSGCDSIEVVHCF
jgi:hypothetical protein